MLNHFTIALKKDVTAALRTISSLALAFRHINQVLQTTENTSKSQIWLQTKTQRCNISSLTKSHFSNREHQTRTKILCVSYGNKHNVDLTHHLFFLPINMSSLSLAHMWFCGMWSPVQEQLTVNEATDLFLFLFKKKLFPSSSLEYGAWRHGGRGSLWYREICTVL